MSRKENLLGVIKKPFVSLKHRNPNVTIEEIASETTKRSGNCMLTVYKIISEFKK